MLQGASAASMQADSEAAVSNDNQFQSTGVFADDSSVDSGDGLEILEEVSLTQALEVGPCSALGVLHTGWSSTTWHNK
jgi:hypothetical protein